MNGVRRPVELRKQLSDNDVGATGAHQAGTYLPKETLSFFPPLDEEKLNPSASLVFADTLGTKWIFRFVHYNNRRFGGTRDEYRLTRMSGFLHSQSAQPGDEIILRRSASDGSYAISCRRAQRHADEQGLRIRFTGSWLVVREEGRNARG